MDELFQSASVVGENSEDTTEWLTIDHDFRRITIPSKKQLLGVTSDENVNILHFRCPRYCNTIDLGDFDFRVNYMNAAGEGDVYLVIDKEVGEDDITFSWTVQRHACLYVGNVRFIVCAKLFDTDTGDILREYNTAVHSLPVVQGLETNDAIREDIEANTDIVEEFLRNAQGIFALSADVQDLKVRVTDLELATIRKVDGAYVTEDGFLYYVVGPLGPFSGGGGGGGGGGGSTTNAKFTATNSSGWMSKTIASDSECIASITWSSIEDEIPTGPGRLAIAVNGAAPAVLQVDQGIIQIDLAKYCNTGLNSCILTLTDIYSNKKTFAFSLTAGTSPRESAVKVSLSSSMG